MEPCKSQSLNGNIKPYTMRILLLQSWAGKSKPYHESRQNVWTLTKVINPVTTSAANWWSNVLNWLSLWHTFLIAQRSTVTIFFCVICQFPWVWPIVPEKHTNYTNFITIQPVLSLQTETFSRFLTEVRLWSDIWYGEAYPANR